MFVIRSIAIALSFLCLFVTPIKADVERVNTPFYGEVLFNFNQQKFFSAIIQLEKNLNQGRLADDSNEAQALLGSLYLSYGLHRNAEKTFYDVLEEAVDESSRNLAWYFLSKIKFQRGYYTLALEYLEKISSSLSKQYEDERWTLTALSLIQLNRPADAIELLTHQLNDDGKASYSRFNLAASLLKLGRTEEAIAFLNDISGSSKWNVESAELIDRANVLLADHFLKRGQFELASQYFSKVEVSGRFSNQALLGLGWSSLGSAEYEAAYTVWSELADRDITDTNVLEVHLAKPYLLYQLGKYSDSLVGYQRAIEVYQQQLMLINQQLDQTDFYELILDMVALDSDEEIGWHWQHDVLGGALLSRYMFEFVSSHEFQESLKNYRDLLFIKNNLDKQQLNIPLYKDIIDVKMAANAELKPRAEERLRQLSEDNKSSAIQTLTDKIEMIELDEDAFALATSTELERFHQLHSIDYRLGYNLENIEDKLDHVKLVERAAKLQKKHELLKGLMKWELMTSYKIRLRNIKKNIAKLEAEDSHSGKLESNIREIIMLLPQNYDGQSEKIKSVRQRLILSTIKVKQLLLQHEEYLQSMLRTELLAVKERIETYHSQALLSVAHIYDINLKINEVSQ